ncbi:MAG: IPT/TIG domain-containing protein, partial [Dehalococcoidia bacterium]
MRYTNAQPIAWRMTPGMLSRAALLVLIALIAGGHRTVHADPCIVPDQSGNQTNVCQVVTATDILSDDAQNGAMMLAKPATTLIYPLSLTPGDPRSNQFGGSTVLDASFPDDSTLHFHRVATEVHSWDTCNGTISLRAHSGQHSSARDKPNNGHTTSMTQDDYNGGCGNAHGNGADGWYGAYGASETDWFYSRWLCAANVSSNGCPESDRENSALDPSVGPIMPAVASIGDAIAVDGDSLTDATALYFGGVSASFTVISDTQLTATVPRGAGAVDVTVSAAGQTTPRVPADVFTDATVA